MIPLLEVIHTSQLSGLKISSRDDSCSLPCKGETHSLMGVFHTLFLLAVANWGYTKEHTGPQSKNLNHILFILCLTLLAWFFWKLSCRVTIGNQGVRQTISHLSTMLPACFLLKDVSLTANKVFKQNAYNASWADLRDLANASSNYLVLHVVKVNKNAKE